MKTLNTLTLVALVTGSFLASSCEKTSDSVAPLSATSVAKDARPETFYPNGVVGQSYEHGAIATGLNGYPNAWLELTKVQGTGKGSMHVYKGTLAAGTFPVGGYATPYTSTFPYGAHVYESVATLDASGKMVVKQYVSKDQY
ncbi:hypothetical protein ACFST9_06355 [Hymenobacter monticola]|uniref:Uncharacterized protein n=1 Tax=Hymenobacter monticola TaxID=1705399 RepID=A0ABY4BEP5_9BACT|nr:hypothetical protein [Hymenobacter monticola]UOE36238.1 hypothetical protein MTP16_11480 [Hymenobacter monticola]